MRDLRDTSGMSDVLEVLVSLMIVSAAVMILATSLPSLFTHEESRSDVSSTISELAPDGRLELMRAESLVASLPNGVGVRILFEGENLTLKETAVDVAGDLHVIRVPVTVSTAAGLRPAILEVSCSG
jgi:hypothetical protein